MSRLWVLWAFTGLACAPSSPEGPGDPRSPREPPTAVATIVDEPYWQELNRTYLDDDPRRQPYHSVILGPPGQAGPLWVGPEGVQDPQGRPLGPAQVGLQHAVREGGLIVLAGSQGLGTWDGATYTSTTVGAPVLGLLAGRERTWVRTAAGLWPTVRGRRAGPTVAATAVWDEEGGPIFAGVDGLNGPGWRLAWPKPIGEVVGLVSGVSLLSAELVVVGTEGLLALEQADGSASWVDSVLLGQGRVPFVGARVARATPDGGLLVGGPTGLTRLMDRGAGLEWRTYPAERWLPSADVYDVAVDPTYPEEGAIWVATGGGPGELRAQRMTLEQKLEPFLERIVARHDRDGAVADSHLTRRGDLSSNIPWDSDNDGSWTSYWLRGECYRFLVTGDPAAKGHFDRALERMLSLQTLTGTDWFLARAVIRKAGCKLDDCDAPDDGQWFTSPDGEWWVKADTSNDEVIAHLGMMGQAHDLCADDLQKEQIARHVAAIVGGIMDHGWQLVDLDGQVTTYGQFDPAYVNVSLPGTIGDGGLRSAAILAGLTLAHYLTGEERFLEGKRTLIEDHGYADNAERELEYTARRPHMDNDEMDVWSWMVLLRYEADPELYPRWQRAWAALERKLSVQQAAWWNLVHLYNGGTSTDLVAVRRWLQLAPVDMIRWRIDNEARQDLVGVDSEYYRRSARQRSDGRPLPYDERPCDRWNTDQYQVSGGFDGWIEMDGADVLEPYWMGRYYGWISR